MCLFVSGLLITIHGGAFGPCCTGTVTISGLPCTVAATNGQWNATVILCTTPAGYGLQNPVYVTIGGQTNAVPGYFDRLPPTIYSIALAPSSFDSIGGPTVFINGSSFSLNANTRIGSYLCPPTQPQTHTAIYCQLPPGQGANLSVSVTTSTGLVSNLDVLFSYDPPVLTSITPTGGVSGTVIYMALVGTSFGLSGTVYIGTGICVQDATTGFWQHHLINCVVPAGTGSNLPVYIVVGGQTSNSKLFSYSPVITGVSVIAGIAYTNGGATIQLDGTGFSVPAVAPATVAVGAQPCTILTQTEYIITCQLPAGEGIGVLVSTTVGGQTSNTWPFTYVGPQISDVFPSNGTAQGGTAVTITGKQTKRTHNHSRSRHLSSKRSFPTQLTHIFFVVCFALCVEVHHSVRALTRRSPSAANPVQSIPHYSGQMEHKLCAARRLDPVQRIQSSSRCRGKRMQLRITCTTSP